MTQTNALTYGDRIALKGTGRVVTVVDIRTRGTFATITTCDASGRLMDVLTSTDTDWITL